MEDLALPTQHRRAGGNLTGADGAQRDRRSLPRGLADDVGVFAEGEPHDFYGTGDGTKPPSFAQRQ